MNRDGDEVYQRYVQAQQHIDHHDRASSISIIAFTILIAYIIFHALQCAGLPLGHVSNSIIFHVRSTLGRLGVTPKAAGIGGIARRSTGLQILNGTPNGAQDATKTAGSDRNLRTLGGLWNNGHSDAPPGMGNWDNSCYQNSVIQGLASLRPIGTFLASALHSYGNKLSNSSTSALFDTIRQLNDEENNGKVLWMPSKLKSMSTWQQQDAQEYFSKVLEEVDKEILLAITKTTALPGLAEDEAEGDLLSVQRPSATPVEGFLAQRVACMRCGYSEGLSMIPFNCVTVPLGRASEYSLSECLEEYTKLEAIEGVECAKCTLLKTRSQLNQIMLASTANPTFQASVKDRLCLVEEILISEDFSDTALTTVCQISKKSRISTTKSRQAVIARAPKALAIHINRSVFDEMTGALMKNYAEVSFPAMLDLGPWCLGKQEAGREDWSMTPAESMLPNDPDNISRPPILYNLRAAVTHYGRHENGHYICYRSNLAAPEHGSSKESEERWWRLSDEDVSPVSEQQVLQQGGVFMLFYEQVEPSARLLEPDWVNVASIVPLPEDEEAPVDGALDRCTEQSTDLATSDELSSERRAQAAALEESKALLMTELRGVLPSSEPEHELTALGEGGFRDEDLTQADASTDTSEHEATAASSPEPSQSSPLLPSTSTSGLKMRTAAASKASRGSEAIDSPLRMASAF